MACNCTSSILTNCSNQDLINLAGIISSLGCGPIGTNLTYMPSPTGGTMMSSTGTPAFIPLVNNINAGLIGPGDYASFLTRTQWMGEWTQQQYLPYQQVTDGGYLAIAKVTTSERPSPQKVGEPFNLYNGIIGTTTAVAKQVIFGNKYTFTENVFFEGWRANLVAGNNYTIYLVRDPDGAAIISQILQFVAQNSGWIDLNAQSLILYAGSTYSVVAAVSEPEAIPVTFNGNWNYSQPQNITVPVSGGITQPKSNPSLLYVSNFDSAAVDRSAELNSLNIGDTIQTSTNLWAIQTKSPQAGYFIFGVSPALLNVSLGVQNFVFETKSTATLTYPLDPNYWALNPSPVATVQGLLGVDIPYSAIVPNTTAYGIDILVQNLVVSADWDIQAISGLGGSGGGGIQSIIPGTNISVNSVDPQNPIISAIPSTSAGVFDRVYFTGQVASVATPIGPNYDTIRNGKGSVALVPLVVGGLNASTKVYIPNDMIGPAQIVAGTLPVGNYTSFLSVQASAAIGLKRFTIEVFLCDNAGVIIPSSGPASGSTDPFYAGKNTVVILDSGDLNLANDDVTQIGLTGYLASPLPAAVGQRFRYHISVSRGTGGAGAQTMTVYIGSNANSYVEAPVPITSSTVVNLSTVPGATVTDALNALSSGGSRDQIIITTAVNISTATLSTDLPVLGQNGKNVIIDNSTAPGSINLTCDGGVTASYLRHGANAVVFVRGVGRELWFEGANVPTASFNGLRGSTANLTSLGLIDYLAIANY